METECEIIKNKCIYCSQNETLKNSFQRV